jgi:hypothetical protein
MTEGSTRRREPPARGHDRSQAYDECVLQVDWNSRPIADDPAALDVERNVAEREPRLIAEASGELEEPVSIGEIARYPKGDADGAGTLPADDG